MKTPKLPTLPKLPSMPKLRTPRLPPMPRLPGMGGRGDLTLEQDAMADFTEAELQIERAFKLGRQYYEQEASFEFYAVLVFQSQEQRDGFFAGLRMKPDEAYGYSFLDGRMVARQMGLTLPASLPWKERKAKPQLAALAMPPHGDVPAYPGTETAAEPESPTADGAAGDGED